MPQNPLAASVAVKAGAYAPIQLDAQGGISIGGATTVTYNISVPTVIKSESGKIVSTSVITAGSTEGSINDIATTGGAAIANQVAVIPNTAGNIQTLNWPCSVGIVVVPGTGQVVSVSSV